MALNVLFALLNIWHIFFTTRYSVPLNIRNRLVIGFYGSKKSRDKSLTMSAKAIPDPTDANEDVLPLSIPDEATLKNKLNINFGLFFLQYFIPWQIPP